MSAKNSNEFGRRFAKVRKQAGFRNTVELEEVTGISHASISNFESGRRPTLDVYELLKICQATGRPITDFVPEVFEHLPETYVDVNQFTETLIKLIKE